MVAARLVSSILTVVNLLLPTLSRMAIVGPPSVGDFVLSHLTFLPPLIAVSLHPFITDVRIEHILRHLSFGMAVSLSILAVRTDVLDATMWAFLVSVQIGLYTFTVTHILEYVGVPLRTHYGDPAVLTFLMFFAGWFACKLPSHAFVFMLTAVISVPVRAAATTIALLSHCDFAQHASTRIEDPSYLAVSTMSNTLTTLFLTLLELEVPMAILVHYAIVTSIMCMMAEYGSMSDVLVREGIALVVMYPIVYVCASFQYGERATLGAILSCVASTYVPVACRLMLKRRMYAPSFLLTVYIVTGILEALDPAADARQLLQRVLMWCMVFAMQLCGIYLLRHSAETCVVGYGAKK